MPDHSEILLSTVQNLRRFLSIHPHALGDIATIESSWLPGELFPPGRTVLMQALNVLINAGELYVKQRDDKSVFGGKAPLDHAPLY